jgi:O-methyltransferase involved in polyketide biosynthesis
MNKEFVLGDVQKTLFLPLWGRAIETQKKVPLLVDNLAVSTVQSINFDFTRIAASDNLISREVWIARSIYFDGEIKSFLEENPEGTIINIGCGLDTTFDRVDNGKALWYELDLPDVIELRKRYIHETERRKFINKSVLDKQWYRIIENKNNVMILLAGVIHYFDEIEVKSLFREFENQFGECDIIFDYCSIKGVKIANRGLLKQAGMNARLKWGIDDIYTIEKWDANFKIVNNMTMFSEYKKKFPAIKRIGMNISDLLKIMSLAHIKLGKSN